MRGLLWIARRGGNKQIAPHHHQRRGRNLKRELAQIYLVEAATFLAHTKALKWA